MLHSAHCKVRDQTQTAVFPVQSVLTRACFPFDFGGAQMDRGGADARGLAPFGRGCPDRGPAHPAALKTRKAEPRDSRRLSRVTREGHVTQPAMPA
eukprot:481225-Rhodomonas_salina.1